MGDRVIRLAEDIFLWEQKHRPETDRIQRWAVRLAEAEGLCSRGETDRLIFRKMYARTPAQTDTVKIRYWRTGRHLPSGREEALMFAQALGLDLRERNWLLQAYMEKSDYLFEKPPNPGEALYSLYIDRTNLMERMISEYIAQIPPSRIIQMNIPYERLGAYARHLYCIELPWIRWGRIISRSGNLIYPRLWRQIPEPAVLPVWPAIWP